MTLHMIGLGLCDEKDITVKGLEAVKDADIVFLEGYTSLLSVPVEKLQKYYIKEIIIADRNMVESNSNKIILPAKEKNVVFLVVGDVFGATTHTDLFLRAKKEGIQVKVINNVSIINAVGIVGLELYKYGKITSVPYFEESFKAKTPYNVLEKNLSLGMHTLMLLDIKADQNRYMTVNEALKQLLDIESEEKKGIFTEDTFVIGCARIGNEDFCIRYGKVSELKDFDFGKPLHCLIVPGELHFIEEEALSLWKD